MQCRVRELGSHRSSGSGGQELQLLNPWALECEPQLESPGTAKKFPHDATKIPPAATKTQHTSTNRETIHEHVMVILKKASEANMAMLNTDESYMDHIMSLPIDSNQSILKETNSEYSLEGLVLTLKLQYFGQLM